MDVSFNGFTAHSFKNRNGGYQYSRNIEARRRENAAFQRFFTRLRDRQNRYFTCPRCRQVVRVPRGKGRINIRCPKCGEQFVRKT